MSGRGRGISNAPAWMTRQNQNQNQLGSGSNGPPESLPPPPSHSHSHSHLPERDAFGRAPRGGGGGGGGGPYALPPRGGGGGGGGDHNQNHNHNHHPYDDRRRGPYDDRDRRRGPYDDPHHRRRGGPPDDWRRGGGGRREMHHRDRDGHRDRRGGGGNHNNSNNNHNNNNNNHNNPDESISSSSREQLAMVTFRSYDEEQDWAEERRRKRKARPSKFDVPPTPQQLAAEAVSPLASNPAATDFAGIPAGRDFSVVPQQTRHARRLYIGHLPPNVHEQELHDFFRNAIETASVDSGDNNNNNNNNNNTKRGNADPILSVYINHERRFCFLEFRDVAMTTACMALDGININGKGKVKVKRPNDYNPTMAPKVHPTGVPILDVSKLGIISSNVQDGPNKVFIGGLHYHLTEAQVLELLQAFGKVKAFHLVKNEPDAITSKGYCFVEFAEPGATPMAVLGLNGMDMGGGKVLTARVAGQRTATGVVTSVVASGAAAAATAAATATSHYGQSAGAGTGAANLALAASGAGGAAAVSGGGGGSGAGGDRLIVGGYDIEALVDAAMGLKPMPMAPTHLDTYGVPVTRMGGAASLLPPARAVPMQMGMGMQMQMPMQMGMQMGMQMQMPMSGIPPPPPPPPQIAAAALPPGLSALDIANAALDAAFGPGASTAAAAAPAPPPPPPPPPPAAAAAASGAVRKTRILVLLNMVENEDLESDEEYKGLMEEVEEEVKKFGKLLSMKIPRKQEGWIEASAIGKIFLEYATTQDAGNAEGELSGRQFGPNVVQASYHDEQEYAALKLR